MACSELLELPDNDLWDIVIGRSDEYRAAPATKSWRACAPPERGTTMADKNATLKLPDGKTLDFPVLSGIHRPGRHRHPHALRQVRACSPTTRASCRRRAAARRSPTSTATPGMLLYRGYPIEQLAQHCDFLEVCYLLLNGELPNTQAEGRVRRHRHAPHHGARAAGAPVPGVPPRRAPDGGDGRRGRRAVGLLPRRARHQRSAAPRPSRRSA